MSRWTRWLPGFRVLTEYKVAWLPHDVIAGFVLTTMLVPVGIAYALASGVPGIYGLYATIVPLLAYAFFGPSRILVLGPDSIELRFAEMKDPVKDKLRRFELFDRFGAANFYPTIGSAVHAYLEEHAVDWKP